jgi:hypothetical protein
MPEEFMMNTLINQAIHSNDRENLSPHHESLPGQRPLFTEDDQLNTFAEKSAENLNGELFNTGKDLPGAKETLQAILWDVK